MSQSIQDRLVRSTDCELRFDNLTRQLYATDASVYQIEPLGVAFPRSPQQAASVIRAAADADVAVIPRGAGTGLAGGAVGRGLIIEFSRYNRQIRDFDPERRTVRVGAGVVLDQLNAFLAPHGLHFGPDVATSSRASLGGMIANNSSGARTPVYGTTADHVLGLEIVLADGSLVHVRREGESGRGGKGEDCGLRIADCGSADPRTIRDPKTAIRNLAAEARAIVSRYHASIAERLPPGLLKRWPGYGLDQYLRHGGDLTRLISGSEGTLAAIVSAELNLVPLPAQRGLGILFFASVPDAMQATVELLDLQPAAVEHIDRLLFDQTRGQLVFQRARDLLRLDEEPCESILLVEFLDDAAEKVHALTQRGIGLRRMICLDPQEQALVWGIRKAGLTLLTARKGPAKPQPGIEDVAVRPEQLPDYVAGLRSILEPLGIEASYYGHAASGLLHVRPVLDLHTDGGIASYRHIADEVSALVRQFKGSIAAEHGVGIARTEYLPEHLGTELMNACRDLKRLFDPRNVMNPGKIIPDGTYRIDGHLRQGPDRIIRLPFVPVLGFVEKDESFVGNLEQCDGSGTCLKTVATMCPTYIVTHEEIMSTRGRANTIRAALEGRIGADPGEALNSPELEAALGPCLSCKACKSECPSNVDLALLKAEFQHARLRRTGIPLSDRLIAAADLLGRIGSATAPLSNMVLQSRPARWLMERTLGIAADRPLPPYARQRFDRWFHRNSRSKNRAASGRKDGPARQHSESRATAFSPSPPLPLSPSNSAPLPRVPGFRGRVILWDDTWVRYHEPHIGIAAVAVLEAAGLEVVLAKGRACCGRPAFSRGLLDEAARLGRHNIDLLNGRYAAEPIIFLEPSCHSMFIDDYRQLRLPGADALARRCLLFEQFMADLLDREPDAVRWTDKHWGPPHRRDAGATPHRRDAGATPTGETPVPHPPRSTGGEGVSPAVAIHAHCHAKALTDAMCQKALAERLPGASVTLLNTACCGMAGAYGMLKDKYDLSLQVAEPFVKVLNALPSGTKVVASGTSCRHQITHLTSIRPLHMAELLAAHL